MTVYTVETAIAAYEAVRHRLPSARRGTAAPCRVATLEDLADRYDVFLLDAFGVLNIGETAIPGVPERVAGLQARGRRVLVVSNAAGASHPALMEKYRRLGYDFAAGDVITSRGTLLAGIRAERGLHWGLMAARSAGLRDLEDLRVTYLQDDPAPYDSVDGFLMIGSAGWTDARQGLLEAALARHPRPVRVGNPDIVAPRETGFSVEPGHFAHRLADRTGVAPQFFGKPFGNIYDLAFARLGDDVPRDRVLMVGDSLHTDILGAQQAGVASALVTDYGLFAGHSPVAAIRGSGISPDYLLARP